MGPPAGVHSAVLLGQVPDGELGRGLQHHEGRPVPKGRRLAPETLVARVTRPRVITRTMYALIKGPCHLLVEYTCKWESRSPSCTRGRGRRCPGRWGRSWCRRGGPPGRPPPSPQWGAGSLGPGYDWRRLKHAKIKLVLILCRILKRFCSKTYYWFNNSTLFLENRCRLNVNFKINVRCRGCASQTWALSSPHCCDFDPTRKRVSKKYDDIYLENM